MPNKNLILLIEDEIKLSQLIKEELVAKGYTVDIAHNSATAEKLFAQQKYNLLLLDINIPGKNGFELCKIFRASNLKVPIIMLTALGEIQDKIDAFDLGVDDYITKPFHFDELFARIKVFLKRTELDKEQADKVITIDDLKIVYNSKSVFRAGNEIHLTQKEFALLSLLALNRGKVIPKHEILEKVWDLTFDTGTNTIEVYISFLRNKIDKPYATKLIHTKSGFGYSIK
jgi:two-component system, OmpR family, copper resistance phosphate regulon response regulator CusR